MPEKILEKRKVKNSVRVIMEALMTVFGDVNLVSTLAEDIYKMYEWIIKEQNNHSEPQSWLQYLQIGAFGTLGLFAIVDAYVHYITYQNKRYDDTKEKDENTGLIQQNDSLHHTTPNQTDMAWKIKLLAFICTAMCATETAMVPAACITLLASLGLININLGWRLTRTAFSIPSIVISFMTVFGEGGSKYKMAEKHLNEHYNKKTTDNLTV